MTRKIYKGFILFFVLFITIQYSLYSQHTEIILYQDSIIKIYWMGHYELHYNKREESARPVKFIGELFIKNISDTTIYIERAFGTDYLYISMNEKKCLIDSSVKGNFHFTTNLNVQLVTDSIEHSLFIDKETKGIINQSQYNKQLRNSFYYPNSFKINLHKDQLDQLPKEYVITTSMIKYENLGEKIIGKDSLYIKQFLKEKKHISDVKVLLRIFYSYNENVNVKTIPLNLSFYFDNCIKLSFVN